MTAESETSSNQQPLVKFTAVPTGPHCPFGNDSVAFSVYRGGCVCLAGNSGAGKTTLSTFLAGLSHEKQLAKLGIQATQCDWDPSIPPRERCGVLFQQTTLLDGLTVAGNVCVALESSGDAHFESDQQRDASIKQLLETVGLDYAKDGPKRPTHLSGGMARRASLALQLAQKKRIIVLDEPFAGLDRSAAASVASELIRLRVHHGTALLLISHEPDLAALVMDETRTQHNVTVTLEPPNCSQNGVHHSSKSFAKPSLFGITAWQRFLEKLVDYVGWSFPLILLTFIACGMAIAMLSSDILSRIDVTDQVLEIVDQEVRPMLKFITGQEDNSMTMMMVKMKIRSMINTVMPQAKASLFAIGMAKLFVLEIGPLLTALLLCGRIGGSYAGKVATMKATAQNKLLITLGINPQLWTLLPALSAALLASPLLTVMGTAVALWLGGIVGPRYGIGNMDSYIRQVRETIFPTLRLRSFVAWEEDSPELTFGIFNIVATLDLRCTWSDSYMDTLVEVATYPPIFLLLKSTTFIVVIMLVAEASARLRSSLTPRNVPGVITSSVVIASLVVIVADWGFSQLWLMRE